MMFFILKNSNDCVKPGYICYIAVTVNFHRVCQSEETSHMHLNNDKGYR